MKKIITTSAFALILGFSGNVFAQHAGGYTGPSIAANTVAEALKLKDDTPVILNGKIEKSLGGEKYIFTDATGSVTVEIDNEDWRGLSVNEKDVVEIRGEVDKEFLETQIDVDSISKK
ncbi:MAG: NirD/YgiW/YdeI family stress tolerance protein [Alphaproteobacteria bacterium]|nr:NirD/YgiW/YdeI family stress tolerance protein [Alphaproteobacteria bacterium]